MKKVISVVSKELTQAIDVQMFLGSMLALLVLVISVNSIGY